MEYPCREISKTKEAKGIFLLEGDGIIFKDSMGKGELWATKFIDYLFRKSYQMPWKEKGKSKDSANTGLENLREMKYLHALITENMSKRNT